MSLTDLLPTYDARLAEHRVVYGARNAVFGAAVTTDLLLSSGLRSTTPGAPNARTTVTAHDLPDIGEWVRLSEEPSREIVFGGIVKLRGRDPTWIRLSARDFAQFKSPGHVRIVCGLSVTSIGDGRSVLSYEVRACATDNATRRLLNLLWDALSPFVGVTMRTAATQVERRLISRVRRDAGVQYRAAAVAGR
jgi:hypothetical protein